MNRSTDKELISIVIPVYNEGLGVELFFNMLTKAIDKNLNKYNFEYIFVNDGSKDDSLDKLKKLSKKDHDVKILNLTRNFGKEVATTAGIHNARGKAVIIMDADGQHPPVMLPRFIAEWKKGAQVVVGLRSTNQKEGFVKKWGSVIFYKIINAGSKTKKLVPRATDFCLISKSVQHEFIKFEERSRITRGLIDWLGYRKAYIEFDAPQRIAGDASYSFSKLMRLATDSFISISKTPLYISAYLGAVLAPLAFMAGFFVFVQQVLLNDPLGMNFTGSAMLGILIVFLVGLLLISQGILGIYLTHVHEQSLGRPLFVVDYENSVGIDSTGK